MKSLLLVPAKDSCNTATQSLSKAGAESIVQVQWFRNPSLVLLLRLRESPARSETRRSVTTAVQARI